MNGIRRLSVTFLISLSVLGCTGMIPMYNIAHEPVAPGLTKEQVENAIEVGAASAGWRTKTVSPGLILATYNIRTHTVMVEIAYTDAYYAIDYYNSIEMKVKCPQDVRNRRKPAKVTNGDPSICGGGKAPAEIHGNYKEWVDGLNGAIKITMRKI